ncbi:MAG: helix-turn-helix domain-containing protein [Fimbriimonadales bacterium]|nr:helix-turn-helix domain-containing protein [Fimbriimonadales bacterium]
MKKSFDPLAYIESAFLDVEQPRDSNDRDQGSGSDGRPKRPRRRRRTDLSAPRPRMAEQPRTESAVDPTLQEIWAKVPKSIEFLCRFFSDEVTANYYRGNFKESRQELIRRLLDPELTLEETSRLLGVCPATVRRYTNKGWLLHHRTPGGQRRFRLSSIVRFVEEHGRFPLE